MLFEVNAIEAEIGIVTSNNGVTRCCFGNVLRAITIKSDHVSHEPKGLNITSDNDFH
jgi:hypothetical protein